MKQVVLAFILLAPLACQAQLITFAGNHDFTSFDHDHSPVTKPGKYFLLTVDQAKPLEIFDLALEISGMKYQLDKSKSISYNHELPLNIGAGMSVLNASGYFRNTLGQKGFEWFLHLEFSNIESNTNYKVTNRSLENFFAFNTPDISYFGNPFFHKVPEPTSLSLIALGLFGLVVVKCKKQADSRIIDMYT